MPHFVLECSESVLGLAAPDALMRAVYSAAEATGLFARAGVGGIKVRINPYKYALNVGGHEHFVHVFAHVMEGRTGEQKKAIADRVVRAITALLPAVEIVSVNVSDFERATYCNAPMVRDGDAPG